MEYPDPYGGMRTRIDPNTGQSREVTRMMTKKAVGLTRKAAEEEMAKILRDISLGIYQEQEACNPLFEDAMKEYLEKVSKVTKVPTTYRHEREKYKMFLSQFGHIRVRNITPKMIEDYKVMREREVTGATVNRDLALLKHFYNTMIAWGYAKENPVRGVRYFKETMGPPRFLTEEEIVRLLDACERIQGWNKTTPYLKAIILLALNTGLRKGNLMALRWDQVDLQRRLITVPRTKNGEFHIVPMSDAVVDELRRLLKQRLQGAEYVFAPPGKDAQRDLRKAWVRVKRESGISPTFRFHDLRHTFASYLVMKGVDLRSVQTLMGHKDITMTLRYSHLSPGHLQEAVNRIGNLSRPNPDQRVDKKTGDGVTY